MAQSTFTMTGLTCGHCVNAVKEEVGELEGVTGVEVNLVSGGESTLTIESDAPLTADDVQPAITEAGDSYTLVH